MQTQETTMTRYITVILSSILTFTPAGTAIVPALLHALNASAAEAATAYAYDQVAD